MLNLTDYGDSCASFYDHLYPTIEPGLLTRLSSLSSGGRVLELGLATGRVALRLAALGVSMHGIEISSLMLTEFRSRPHAGSVKVVQGNFASLPFDGAFQLIFSLTSTFHLLPSIDLQQQCLLSVSRALTHGGCFLSEGSISATHELSSHNHTIDTPAGFQTYRVRTLPTSTDALDAMAHRAGLRLQARWANWHGVPFDNSAQRHISLYRRDF